MGKEPKLLGARQCLLAPTGPRRRLTACGSLCLQMDTFDLLPGSAQSRRIVLQPDPEPPVEAVEEWDALAANQGRVTAERLRDALAGEYFALEDRNSMADSWRRIFIVCDGTDFVLYCQKGMLIDEPSQGVLEGHQSISSLVDEFDEEHGFYYRPPLLRRPPTSRRQQVHASAPAAKAMPRERRGGSVVPVRQPLAFDERTSTQPTEKHPESGCSKNAAIVLDTPVVQTLVDPQPPADSQSMLPIAFADGSSIGDAHDGEGSRSEESMEPVINSSVDQTQSEVEDSQAGVEEVAKALHALIEEVTSPPPVASTPSEGCDERSAPVNGVQLSVPVVDGLQCSAPVHDLERSPPVDGLADEVEPTVAGTSVSGGVSVEVAVNDDLRNVSTQQQVVRWGVW